MMWGAIKGTVFWVSICAFFSVAAVSCGKYHTEAARFEHEEWLIRQEHCAKRGGLMSQSAWTSRWNCEVPTNG